MATHDENPVTNDDPPADPPVVTRFIVEFHRPGRIPPNWVVQYNAYTLEDAVAWANAQCVTNPTWVVVRVYPQPVYTGNAEHPAEPDA
jgi:hypothetical protein